MLRARLCAQLMSALSLRSMRARVDGIVKRRHRLAQRALIVHKELEHEQAALQRLERVNARLLQRRRRQLWRHLAPEEA